ncbi:MAG: response regulator transcription factor [Chloroflexi bacterium]|nr:response regulator transcription factor [Chloroflexota bacterium]
MRILIAEDDAVPRMILKIAVEKFGHACLVAEDGAQAWEMFQSGSINVVISDRVMPGMDGIELCRRIRAAPKPGYTYFIFLSAMGEREEAFVGLQAGADDYLTKPFDPDELRARLLVAARVTELHRQLAEQQAELVPCLISFPTVVRPPTAIPCTSSDRDAPNADCMCG